MKPISLELDPLNIDLPSKHSLSTEGAQKRRRRILSLAYKGRFQKDEQMKSLPNVNPSSTRNRSNLKSHIKTEPDNQCQSYRDKIDLRISSVGKSRAKPQQLSKFQILRYASLHNKSQIIVFKNQLIKKKLQDQQNSRRYKQANSIEKIIGSNRPTQQAETTEIIRFQKISKVDSDEQSPTVFLATSLWNKRIFHNLFSKKVKVILAKKQIF